VLILRIEQKPNIKNINQKQDSSFKPGYHSIAQRNHKKHQQDTYTAHPPEIKCNNAR
jgi:hypothetical protein